MDVLRQAPDKEFLAVELECAEDVRGAVRARMTPMPSVKKKDTAAREQLGRWGEQFAFEYLRVTEQQRPAAEQGQVVWVNGEAETGSPYDVTVQRSDGVMEYVEVKTTAAANKHYFEVSHNEWAFAEEQGVHYSILRVVCGRDVGSTRVVAIRSPVMQWKQSRIGMALSF